MHTTPEQLITLQAHSAKMLMRVSELAIKKQISISYELGGCAGGHIALTVYWVINGKCFFACEEATHCYSWRSVAEIEQWILNANIAIDLLEVELKAA